MTQGPSTECLSAPIDQVGITTAIFGWSSPNFSEIKSRVHTTKNKHAWVFDLVPQSTPTMLLENVFEILANGCSISRYKIFTDRSFERG